MQFLNRSHNSLVLLEGKDQLPGSRITLLRTRAVGTANAWGTIAARRFGTIYPATAVRGTTGIALAGQTLSQIWPMAADPGPLRLRLPDAQTPLLLTQSGGAGPWALVSVMAAVPL